jgi:hypothetical protein
MLPENNASSLGVCSYGQRENEISILKSDFWSAWRDRVTPVIAEAKNF